MPANYIELNIFRDNLQWFGFNGKCLAKMYPNLYWLLSLGDKLLLDSFVLASCIVQCNELLEIHWKIPEFCVGHCGLGSEYDPLKYFHERK